MPLVGADNACSAGLCPNTWLFSILVAVACLALYFAIAAMATNHRSPWTFLRSGDGRLSTSKFQFFVWTGVVVFTFSAYQFARFYNHRWDQFDSLTTLPTNVLWAMGMAAGTSVLAKGIAASYDASGRTSSVPKADSAADTGLVTGDDGSPDLSKIQMLTWTAIAVVSYFANAIHGLGAFAVCDPTSPSGCSFPDLSSTLLALMGIGQAGYLGTKLTDAQSPRITAINPATGAGNVITLLGQDFGNVAGTIVADGIPLAATNLAWTDTQVQFEFPVNRPDGTKWPPAKIVNLGLIVNGQPAANTVPFAP